LEEVTTADGGIARFYQPRHGVVTVASLLPSYTNNTVKASSDIGEFYFQLTGSTPHGRLGEALGHLPTSQVKRDSDLEAPSGDKSRNLKTDTHTERFKRQACQLEDAVYEYCSCCLSEHDSNHYKNSQAKSMTQAVMQLIPAAGAVHHEIQEWVCKSSCHTKSGCCWQSLIKGIALWNPSVPISMITAQAQAKSGLGMRGYVKGGKGFFYHVARFKSRPCAGFNDPDDACNRANGDVARNSCSSCTYSG